MNRLRISIFGLLVAVSVVSFGCGGGGSRSDSTPGGDFSTAVTPDVESTPGEGENVPGSSTGLDAG